MDKGTYLLKVTLFQYFKIWSVLKTCITDWVPSKKYFVFKWKINFYVLNLKSYNVSNNLDIFDYNIKVGCAYSDFHLEKIFTLSITCTIHIFYFCDLN